MRCIIFLGEISMELKDNILVMKEKEWYVAKCIDNNIASQG